MAHITGLYRRQPNSIYMETAYPILRQVFLQVNSLASLDEHVKEGANKTACFAACSAYCFYTSSCMAVTFLRGERFV